jgi:WD40-like Beta Propeller Repeat
MAQLPKPTPAPASAKINQKLVVRTLLGLVTLAILLVAYNWFKGLGDNFDDLGKANTAGMIAAIEFKADGQQVVAVSPDGKITENAGYKAGSTDRDLAWDPEGNRLYFVSDRLTDDSPKAVRSFNIFRWNPVTNAEPSQRTIGTRGRSNPYFDAQSTPDEKATALITSGGFVQEFNPKDRSTRQVLPPLGREVAASSDSDDAGGSDSQFTALYGGIGTSFRIAKWMKNRTYIAAIMRRDEGETLLIQNMEEKNGKFEPPAVIAAGSHIDITISRKDGVMVYNIQDFQWPDPRHIPEAFRKDGKISRPVSHMVGIVDPDSKGPSQPIVASSEDNACFGSVAASPDGSRIAVVLGPFVNGAMDPKALYLFPLKSGAQGAGARLVAGAVFEPTWSPDGKQLAYVKRDADGKRSIYVINADGSGERSVTGGKGDFGYPVFSPQTK